MSESATSERGGQIKFLHLDFGVVFCITHNDLHYVGSSTPADTTPYDPDDSRAVTGTRTGAGMGART